MGIWKIIAITINFSDHLKSFFELFRKSTLNSITIIEQSLKEGGAIIEFLLETVDGDRLLNLCKVV